MPELPSGTVTFLFTDIEGSTRLWEQDAEAMRTAVMRHLALLDAAITEHAGVRYKVVGDAVQAAFPTAPQAIAAALAAQRAILAEDWGALGALQVRMALHAGDAQPDTRGDYLAAPLNRLSRLLEGGHGGQILVTAAAAALMLDAMPPGARLQSLGDHAFRDLRRPEQVFQLIAPGLPTEFPPLHTETAPPSNLPLPPTPFLGRGQEQAEIEALLMQPAVRLLTLTGLGGVGKTRLALHVAAAVREDFADGICFVDLSRLTDPAMVPAATASALDLREHPGQSLSEVVASDLRDKHLLLFFDNFEHVIAAATLVSELLAAAPRLKVLVTSRSRLGLQAEQEYRVETLAVPDLDSLPSFTDLAQNDAVALFVTRARSLRPDFALDEANARTIGEIVCRLDGLPLAIELAAAWVKLLPPEALLQRLDRPLAALTGGARDLPPRQQTLRETIAWSVNLLGTQEQSLLRRLSVFVGGWTVAAAEAVTEDVSGLSLDVYAGLATLLDQSLIDQHHDPDPADGPRFRMLETIREFASEQLAANGEQAAAEHAFEHFLVNHARQAEAGLSGADQSRWLERLEMEHDNLRAALGRMVERGDADGALALAPRLWRFWMLRGYPGEGRSWLERALSLRAAKDPDARARAEFGLGKLCSDLGDFTAANTHFRECEQLRRGLGDMPGVAEALSALAVVAVNQRNYEEARELGEEALQISRAHGDDRTIGRALHDLAMVAREQGDFDRARGLYTESLTIWNALDDRIWRAFIELGLGITEFLDGYLPEARRRIEAAQTLYRSLGDRYGLAVVATELGHLERAAGERDLALEHLVTAIGSFKEIGAADPLCGCLELIAVVAAERGEPAAALRLIGAVESARSQLDLPPPGDRDAHLVAASKVRASLAAGEKADSLLREGQRLSLDEATNEALHIAGIMLAGPRPDKS